MDKQEVIVVTGAAAGLGRAVAREFAGPGKAIALLARSTESLEDARREIEDRGGRAMTFPVDVADASLVERTAERIESDLGPIDIWVNDAMTTIFAPLIHITPEEYKRATEVTYLGTVYGTMAALKHMYPRNRGTIVQIGSALAYRAIPLQSPYCGAKHAIRGFTDSLRSELIHDRKKIYITMVQLPGMNTPQFSWCRAKLGRHPQPVPPIFQPEVCARAVVYAARHRRREYNVGWPTVKAIWGNKFVPGWLDHYLARFAWSGQMTGDDVTQGHLDNLFQPLPGDAGAHGIFDDRARSYSGQWWFTTHRSWFLIGAAVAGAALAGALGRKSLQNNSRLPRDRRLAASSP
jgi:short-subunit dehydrogenase